MRQLIDQRFVIRRNLLAIIMIGLSVYFCYHTVMGQRSFMRLVSLERSISHASNEYSVLKSQRLALQSKVMALRPGSLDRDLLEERVRAVLGYVHPDEHLILVSSNSR